MNTAEGAKGNNMMEGNVVLLMNAEEQVNKAVRFAQKNK